MKKLLLISSSRTHGTGFLEHCADAIKTHLQGIQRVLFVPFALANREAYARLAAKTLGEFGFQVESLHAAADPLVAVQEAQAIFTGGGNTFRLLKTLYDKELLIPIRQRVLDGAPYMGSSAGSNLACPTIRTTNDMPIVEPPCFGALNLIPFQINPHFIDADPDSTHQGETREARLLEYLEENPVPVLGIREGSWLNIRGNDGLIEGHQGGVLFRPDVPRHEMKSGDSLRELFDGDSAATGASTRTTH